MAQARDFILQHKVIRTPPIKQYCICHADTIHLLHVAYTEQSVHQTSNPNIDIDISVHTYSPLLNSAIPEFL